MAVHPFLAFHTLLFWGALFAMACAAAKQLRHDGARRGLLYGLIVLSTAECIYSLFFRDATSFRLHGTFANADAFAGLLAITLPITLGLLLDHLNRTILRGRNTLRWHLLRMVDRWQVWAIPSLALAFLLQLVVLFFTGSRGATAAALTALAVLLVWQLRETKHRRRLMLMALTILLLFVAFFHIHALRMNVLERTFSDSFDMQSDVAGRTEIWKAAIALIHDFPLGTGPGGTAQLLSMYQSDTHGRYRLDYAHNDTLQFLGDLGWPGFLMLLGLLTVMGRRVIRACRRRDSNHAAPWILRGAALALGAAFLHSQVEFNLSARPPLQLIFALLAGMLFAGGNEAPTTAHVPSLHRRRLAFLLVGILALTAAGFSITAAMAYRLTRAAARALHRVTPDTDSALFLPAPLPPEAISSALATATRLAPRCPFVYEISAVAPIAAHRTLVEQTAQANIAAFSDSLPSAAPALGTNPDAPDLSPGAAAALSSSALALRPEEAASLRTALPSARTALRLAPWSATAMTSHAWFLLRATALHLFPDAEEAATMTARAHADLALAAALYPADALVLSDICAALTAEDAPGQNLPDILRYAERAFTLNPSLAITELKRWWRAGIPLSRLSLIPGIPIPVLQQLYRHVSPPPPSIVSPSAAVEAEAILDLIDRQTRPDAPPPAAALRLWKPPQLQAWTRQQTRYQNWVVSQRLRRDLLQGRWASVMASAPIRAAARIARFQTDIAPLKSSPILLRLRLREWNDTYRLPLTGRMEWAISECTAGTSPQKFTAIWEEAARHPQRPDEQSAWLAEHNLLPDAPPAPSPAADTLSLPYLGERLFLEALTILPTTNRPTTYLLQSTWRFQAAPLPPHLKAILRLRDSAGRLITSRTLSFDAEIPSYLRGNPPPETTYTHTLSLPTLTPLASTLEIYLHDGKKYLPQDDLSGHLLMVPPTPLETAAP